MEETVVLVPGIGFGGIELLFLALRLRRNGYQTTIFWKNPWRRSLSESAAALRKMLVERQLEAPHFVAHSLGGLVVLRLLSDFPEQGARRILLMGTPLSGCCAAQRVLRLPGGRWVIGQALALLDKSPPMLPASFPVGMIAGKLNFLLGLFLCPGEPNDTLVCVRETQHPALASHCILPASHTSMLFSRQVGEHILNFLRTGVFASSDN